MNVLYSSDDMSNNELNGGVKHSDITKVR